MLIKDLIQINGLCAGHVDAGESLESAALREIKEEIGIDITTNDLKPFAKREFTIRDSNSHITYFYYAKSNLNQKAFIIQKEELSEVKLFDIDNVIDMIKSKDDSIVFREERLSLFEQLKDI